MKKIFGTLITMFIVGGILRVPLASVSNSSFRGGEMAALQQSFMNLTGLWQGGTRPCADLIDIASGIMAVDTLDDQKSADWLAGCQYVQDLLN